MLTKVIEQAKIDHFSKWFERADKIVIVSHVSPDGDAIGSSLGLYHFLDSQENSKRNCAECLSRFLAMDAGQ